MSTPAKNQGTALGLQISRVPSASPFGDPFLGSMLTCWAPLSDKRSTCQDWEKDDTQAEAGLEAGICHEPYFQCWEVTTCHVK